MCIQHLAGGSCWCTPPSQIEALDGILEDITLGGESLLGAEHHHEALMDKFLTLGDYPVRVSGMKVYRSADDDTCILETPAMWGSNMIVSGATAAGWGLGRRGALGEQEQLRHDQEVVHGTLLLWHLCM
jgi:hypothetical protein